MRKASSTNSLNRLALVETCIAHEALARLALRWKVPVLHAIAGGATTYGALRKALPKITDQMLATRLRDLVAERLVTKAGPGYRTTPSGDEALAIVAQICGWARRNGAVAQTARSDQSTSVTSAGNTFATLPSR